MANMKSAAQLVYKQVQGETAKFLRPLGFKRKGTVLFKREAEIFGVLQFQSAPSSTKTEISFTINFGVIIAGLESEYRYNQIARYPSSVHLHVCRRIGQNTWWSVTNETDMPAFNKYLLELVVSDALPFVEEYMNLENVLRMWEGGQSIGLAEGQRLIYLEKLKHLLEKRKNTEGIG